MADTLDILTLTEGHTAVNIPVSNTDHDTELAQHITAVSRIIDSQVGPVVNRTITAEVHRGGGAVRLNHTPVSSVTTVREASAGTITTHPAVTFGQTTTGYTIDTQFPGVIYYAASGYASPWPYGSDVEVTYVAGRAANTAGVDARFKACAAAILRRLWKRESGTWGQSSDFFVGQDGQVDTVGFFRVAKPIIDDMLADQRLAPAIA